MNEKKKKITQTRIRTRDHTVNSLLPE